MSDDIRVIRHEEANERLAQIDDAITRRLVDNALFHFFKKFYNSKEYPACDFDMLYFQELLVAVFSEHDVLQRILAGEEVGSMSLNDGQELSR
jgi:hypothetical protein